VDDDPVVRQLQFVERVVVLDKQPAQKFSRRVL
jgi:hypothetical protein